MLIWHAFVDKEPPTRSQIDDSTVTLTSRVLATNNINARDATGEMSHVWLVRPHRTESQSERARYGDWVGYGDFSDRPIQCLTHWADPFDCGQPTHQHIRRGGFYTELARGQLQSDRPVNDMEELVTYRGEDGRIWYRVPSEFDDLARFKRVNRG